jgi:hypothetical protein
MKAKIIKLKNLGTDNLVIVFVAMLSIVADLRKVIKDFSMPKLIQFAFGLLEYAAVITIAPQAFKEFKDLNAVEAKQVEEQVRNEFDIEDDDFEQALEEAITLITDTYAFLVQGASIGNRYVAYYNKYIKGEDTDGRFPEEKKRSKAA